MNSKTLPTIKHSLFSILLFCGIFFISIQIIRFVQNENLFNISFEFSLKIVLLLLLNLYLLAIAMATWKNWWAGLITSGIISIAIFIAIFQYNTLYATIIGSASFLYLGYNIYRSFYIKKLLIKFNPFIILRYSIKGLLFILSVMAAAIVLLSNLGIKDMNIGQMIAGFAEEPVKKIVEQQISTTSIELEQEGVSQISPELGAIMKSFGIDSIPTEQILQPQYFDVDVGNIIEDQVNNFVEPYRNLLYPIYAILMFGLFQFYAYIAYILYSVTINGLFKLAKKLKIVSIEVKQVDQEQLRF